MLNQTTNKMKEEIANTKFDSTSSRPVNQMTADLVVDEKKAAHDQLVQKATDAIKNADHFILFTMDDLSESHSSATLAIQGNLPKVLEAFIDTLEANEEIGMMFKLMQLRKMMI